MLKISLKLNLFILFMPEYSFLINEIKTFFIIIAKTSAKSIVPLFGILRYRYRYHY